ncbi:MAG: histidine kinase [Chitinophagaceae bacterium]|nr:histidine kinase [Chitinophagaceae bacterium]
MQSANPACKAIGYEKAAKELFDRKSFDSSELFLQTALENYKKISCSESKYLQVYKLFSRLYENKAEFQQSLEYSLKALPIAENAGLHTERADILLNIAQVFNRLRQPDKAILYTRQSVPVVAKLSSSTAKAELLNKITARYFFYFQDVDDPTYADTAEVYVKEALIVAKEVNNTKEQIIALTRMNAIYESRKEYQKALGFIDEALVMCNPVEHKRQFTTLYGDKGYLLMKLNNFSEARRFADSCLFYCQEEKYPPLIANAYSLIFEIENKAGNYKEAVWALTNEKTITDSLSSTEKAKAVNELEKKYNQARNEKTIKELAQQKEIYFLLAAAGLLGLIAIAFFLRQQSLKHKQRIMETEQRLNRARMNPHFFFNALASLQSFAVRENDGEAIAANLSKFSHIMRETLESTYKEYVTVEQEMDFLNEYLDVQKIRFPKKFSYSVTADKNVEVDETHIPAMIIQPFAENSIEHGFSNIDYPGLLNIHFSKNGKQLLIEIKDNGKGLGSAAKESNEHISRASQIIRDRIYLLNIKLKTKASFSIDNIPPGADSMTTNGVIVKINLPLIYIESKSTP